MLMLYGHPLSAPTREIRVLCHQLNIEYEMVVVQQTEGPYLPEALNPLCKVPMIDDDGFVLSEVHAIQRYLVQSRRAAAQLYPAQTKARAVADQWLAWQQRLALQSAELIYCRKLNPQLEAAGRVERAESNLAQLLPELQMALEDGTVDGNGCSLVTIAVGVSLQQLSQSDFSLLPWPAIEQLRLVSADWPGFTLTGADAKVSP